MGEPYSPLGPFSFKEDFRVRSNLLAGVYGMAKAKTTNGRAAWEVDFLSVELDSEGRKFVQGWDKNGTESFTVLENSILAGCKLSIVQDSRNECVIASLTSPKLEGGGHQQCLSARGPGVSEAMRVLAYKFSKILGGDFENAKEITEARNSWG